MTCNNCFLIYFSCLRGAPPPIFYPRVNLKFFDRPTPLPTHPLMKLWKILSSPPPIGSRTWKYFEVFILRVNLNSADYPPPPPLDGTRKYVKSVKEIWRNLICRNTKKYVENIKKYYEEICWGNLPLYIGRGTLKNFKLSLLYKLRDSKKCQKLGLFSSE